MGLRILIRFKRILIKDYKTQHFKSEEFQKHYGYKIKYLKNGNILVHNGCKIHGDVEVTPRQFNNRTKQERKDFTVLCPICNPERNSETSIETIVKSILEKFNVNYEQHNRKVIKPKELDFYLPNFNVAIECNRLFWHSEERHKNLQQEKYKKCLEKGIQLFQFWEDDLHNKKEIIEDLISSRLVLNKKIFARNCRVKEIDLEEANQFLNNYHLLGSSNSDLNFGLFYQGTLVEVTSFIKIENQIYQLDRFCSKSRINVVRGLSKILKFFISKNVPSKVICKSYNDFASDHTFKF